MDTNVKATVQPLSSPDGKSSSPNFQNTASIQAGTSDTKATLSLGGFVPSPTSLIDYLRVQIGGDAPVSKGSMDDTDIGTVSGLTAGASANAGISAFWWPHQSEQFIGDQDAVCDSYLPVLIAGYRFEQASDSHFRFPCAASSFTVETLQALADALTKIQTQCEGYVTTGKPAPTDQVKDKTTNDYPATKKECDALAGSPTSAELTAAAKNPAKLKAIRDQIKGLAGEASGVTVLTLGSTVNRQKVSFFNKSDLSTLINDHSTGYGVNLTLSLVEKSYMLDGGLSYEKTFKSGTATQVCSPISGSTSTKCQTGTIGDPPGMFSRILFFEGRVLIIANQLAVAPRTEYDFTAKKFAFKVPLYFAPDATKALTGGVTLGYVSGGEGFGASVFVGKQFSFY
jgi:hypothetical protein